MSIEQLLRHVVTEWDNLAQVQFLKILPIFNCRAKIISIWCCIYDDIISLLSREQIKNSFFKSKVKRLQIEKRTTLNFIEKAVVNKYIILTDDEFEEIKILLTKHSLDLNYIEVIQFYKNLVRADKLAVSPETNIIVHFDEFSAKEIANSMTVKMSEIIAEIDTREFILTAMTDETSQETCPHLYNSLKEFQKYGYWVPTMVLCNTSSKEEQLELVKKFIDIAVELKNLNNYHLLFAIIGGLNSRTIQRLKYLWNENSEHQQKLYYLETVISHTFSHKNYRQLLKNIKSKPVVPYTGVILKDIKQFLECSPYTHKGVNWHLYKSLNRILTTFDGYTKYYNIVTNPRARYYLDNLYVCSDEEELYAKSNLYKSIKGSTIALDNSTGKQKQIATSRRRQSVSLERNLSLPTIPEKVSSHPRSISISFSGKPCTSMDQWSTAQVITWLNSFGLGEYGEIFKREAITGFSLVELTEQDMVTLGINKMGDRIKLAKLVALVQ